MKRKNGFMSIENKCLISVIIMWLLGMFLGIYAIININENKRLKKELSNVNQKYKTLEINYNDLMIDKCKGDISE